MVAAAAAMESANGSAYILPPVVFVGEIIVFKGKVDAVCVHVCLVNTKIWNSHWRLLQQLQVLSRIRNS